MPPKIKPLVLTKKNKKPKPKPKLIRLLEQGSRLSDLLDQKENNYLQDILSFSFENSDSDGNIVLGFAKKQEYMDKLALRLFADDDPVLSCDSPRVSAFPVILAHYPKTVLLILKEAKSSGKYVSKIYDKAKDRCVSGCFWELDSDFQLYDDICQELRRICSPPPPIQPTDHLEFFQSEDAIRVSYLDHYPREVLSILKKIQPADIFLFLDKMPEILSLTRRFYFSKLDAGSQVYDNICMELKRLYRPNLLPSPSLPVGNDNFVFNEDFLNENVIKQTYQRLYNVEFPGLPTKAGIQAELTANRIVIVQIYILFTEMPNVVIKLLQFMTQELMRCYFLECNEKFPQLDPNSYDFIDLQQISCPIPKVQTRDKFKGLKKHGMLECYLMALFTKHKLNPVAQKWIGLIPDNIAHPLQERGTFFKESVYDIFSLTHGLYTHPIHFAMIIYAFEAKIIKTTFPRDDDEDIEIQLCDIFEHMTEAFPHDKLGIWGSVFDSYHPRPLSKLSFNEPHSLASFIMREGHKHKLTALAHYLIDAACKAMFDQIEANKLLFKDMENLTIEKFVDKMGDVNFRTYLNHNKLFKYALEKEKKKNKVLFAGLHENAINFYAVIEKPYRKPKHFEPRTFTQDELKSDVSDKVFKAIDSYQEIKSDTKSDMHESTLITREPCSSSSASETSDILSKLSDVSLSNHPNGWVNQLGNMGDKKTKVDLVASVAAEEEKPFKAPDARRL